MAPRIIERGEGRPIVLVPGIQGRHEWSLPTVEALAALGRVITYSLADEPTSGFSWQGSLGFENYLRQLDEVIQRTDARRPVLVGVSYGGAVVTEYAARHRGEVAGLVVASAPPPAWLPARARRYMAAPILMTPAFLLGAPFRAYPEIRAAFPEGRERWRFLTAHGRRVASAPTSPLRMVRRLRWLEQARFSVDQRLDLPAMIVTGEDALERVVPPSATRQYARWLPHAPIVTLAHTGHIGTVTKTREFTECVATVVRASTSRSTANPLPEFVRAHRVS